ncbi:MAG: diaminopimelate epimerase [Bacteroidetes bacterium GWF2_40_14]|nr:MAG: diaminopimelate epimerase [Bacteroidetes bacterium GWF2_40_14]
MLINKITEIIGKTPIIKIDLKIHGLSNIELYAKLEYLNPFGSLKDRTAFGMLKESIDDIKRSGKSVIETSSGNTAKALQCICSINGIDFITVTNRIKVSESKNILKFLGTNVIEVSKDVNTVGRIEEMIAQQPDKYYHTSQYTNSRNVSSHFETGREIYEDIGKVDYFISVLGTSGSSMGISKILHEKNPEMLTVGVVTSRDSYIPGIRTEEEMQDCGFFSKENYDFIEDVGVESANIYMKKLCREMGILAGVSSGAALAAAVNFLGKIDKALKEKHKAVFVVCDRLEIYANFIKENRFYKYHVLGNTYIVIDPRENPIDLTRQRIADICNKEFGVGADGIILGPFINNDEYVYRAFNRDGSEVKSAVFGSMIFAKYLKDKEIVRGDSIKVRISDQEMKVLFLNQEATKILVKIKEPHITGSVSISGKDYTCVNLGNDNIVREEKELSRSLIIAEGEEVMNSGIYPDGVNIQLVNRISDNHLQIETYERGVGYTLASGTSVIASCFAQKEHLKREVNVHTAGGMCKVNLVDYSITAEVFKIYEGEL